MVNLKLSAKLFDAQIHETIPEITYYAPVIPGNRPASGLVLIFLFWGGPACGRLRMASGMRRPEWPAPTTMTFLFRRTGRARAMTLSTCGPCYHTFLGETRGKEIPMKTYEVSWKP
jgi:hypothetical protein